MCCQMEFSFTINTEYAEKYEKKKKAEELSRLQEKYGGQIPSDSDTDSTSEEEDEEGEDDTAEKSKDFFRVLSLLKKKDPRIYDKEIDLLKDSEEPSTVENKTIQQIKPMYLKDYERERLLEKGTMAGVSDSDEEEMVESGSKSKGKILYDQEQRDNMESFKQAIADIDSDSEGILTIRQKTDEEKKEEEADYIRWLKGHEAELHTEEMKDMEALREYWTKPTLDNDEEFLRDYILNKKWIDRDSNRLPHYDEIVAEFPDPSDDEDNIEKQDQFEEKFNFRFEEPGGTKIASYPRNLENSLRKPDERRKDKRKEREERKAKEKEQKKEEIRRLKNLKKQEIMDKLEKIKKITGNSVVGFNVEDFEKDFDPAHHEKMMREQFGEDYYGEGMADEEKPQFSDMSDEEEDWDNWDPPTAVEEEAPHCEDPDFNMDAEYDPTGEESTTSKRKKRRQNLFSKAVKKKKPSFDPEGDKEFEDYFNEYYKLDYEDIIGGDLPCRFHYRQTVPNDFGLSTDEVLFSEDKELNKWVSLKKAVQYRAVDEEKNDVKKYKKKSKDISKKQRILASLTATSSDGVDGVSSEPPTVHVTAKKQNSSRVKKSNKNGGRRRNKTMAAGVSDSRLSSYGLTSNKITKRKRTKNKTKSK